MKLFKKKEIEVDNRTDLEIKFEETGQKVGIKTGKMVQKGIHKANEIKEKVKADGTFDKAKALAQKAEDKIDVLVDKVTEKSKVAIGKISKSKD
jgi:hypothetical protein